MKILQFLLFNMVMLGGKAQIPDYYVFLVKGDVEVSRPGTKAVLLKQNNFVFKDQIIHLKEKAEITLSDNNQNFFVLKTAGAYKAKDLAKANYYHVPGVTEKYLKLVWSEFFSNHHDYTKFKKSNIAGVYGGVSRGSDCNNLLYPIQYLKTAEDSLHFNWLKTSLESAYTFSIYDKEGTEVVAQIVKDTQATISLKSPLNLMPGKYYWKITSSDGTCEDEEPLSFEVLSPENERMALALIINKENSVPDKLAAIDKMEKGGFIPAASKYFADLVAANPMDKALRKSYVLFLIKYNFEKEADEVWQQISME